MNVNRYLIIWLILLFTALGQCMETNAVKLAYRFTVTGFTENKRFVRPSGLFYEARSQQLYVADTGNNQIAIFDKNGMPVTRFLHTIRNADGQRQLGMPHSVVVKQNGDVLVADNMCAYIDVLDYQGRSVQKIWPGDLLHLPREKVRAGCLALDVHDNLYVSVTGAVNEILQLSPGYELKSELDKQSATRGAYHSATGLWVDRDGKLYATYAQGTCVQMFSADGTLQRSFGQHDSGLQNFSLPMGVVTDAQHHIWVVDTLRSVVSIFTQDKDGNTSYLDMIGGSGESVGNLTYPSAIAGDGATLVFILENTGARLQAFQIILPSGAH